ncbi:prophage LambdaSa04 protein [Desmospora sp. 8437]|nr:prophage LambdaSa04 protein [Desmospora sp. 8437]
MEKAIKWILGLGGASASFLWGGWSSLLGVLLFLVILDYLSGMTAAAMEGKLNSGVGMIGITKKILTFALVAVAHLVDGTLGENHLFRDAAIFFYLANEMLSILENAGRIGVPIPPGFHQAIELLKGKEEEK